MNLASFFSGPDHKAEDPVLVRVEHDESEEKPTIETADHQKYRELTKKLLKHNNLDDAEWEELEKLKDTLGITDN